MKSYVGIAENIVYIGFCSICGFRYSLGVLVPEVKQICSTGAVSSHAHYSYQ